MKQSTRTFTGQRWLLAILTIGITIGITIGTATQARAQVYVSPFIGYDFGGDAGCPDLRDCEDKKVNAGVSVGSMGDIFGVEAEVAYARDFFGEAPGLSSSVMTVMGNLMLAPNLGPLRPYVLAGIGLIKTHVELTPASLFTTNDNNLGWDIGGGLMGFFGEYVGLRGDVRYFHSFQDLSVLGFTLGDLKLNYGRASVGVVLRF